ncbi:copper homeostasis protein [Cnuella takakiae]|uniref:PF03932 family protein CutC n=1 Tax=Cnuella takakiae TaxID=1302690 RepID=A0A1M5E0G7_9BACT|nr:copper homeostasis protein CutC [Cnuella takakiae]OLY93812.1 copper homeostasis protein CutC [Cnuella takakiae]SHF72758.1 copper homeostasis protein [Cnuella takakiae]
MAHNYTLEIAVNDYPGAAAAAAGGADRIELCNALSEGGLTPSFGLIRKCLQDFTIPIFPIIRPRSGDFLYTNAEFEIMVSDLILCKELGCKGVVVGFLNADGSVDQEKTERFCVLAAPMEVTFHRAFDRCVNPFAALEVIITAGCKRILTSGQQLAAPDGARLIADLVKAAAGRISIMPGSGVRPENISALATQTGATEFHSSMRSVAPSAMQYKHPSFAAVPDDYVVSVIKDADVREARRNLGLVLTDATDNTDIVG